MTETKVVSAVDTGDNWVELDLSAYVGSISSLAFLKVKETTGVGTAWIGFRPYGATFVQDYDSNGCNNGICNGTDYSYYICSTNDAGKLEWRCVNTYDIWLVGYVEGMI
jgi:hypothetical protein